MFLFFVFLRCTSHFSRIIFANIHRFFLFLLLGITTEAMGIWRFAGAFAVVERQSECGSKTAGMHVSQPMTHRRVLWPVVLLFFSRFVVNWLKAENLFILHFCQSTAKVVIIQKDIQSRSRIVFFFFQVVLISINNYKFNKLLHNYFCTFHANSYDICFISR